MDQVKIGKFIAMRRKSANLTQMQLADRLGITRYMRCPQCGKKSWQKSPE